MPGPGHRLRGFPPGRRSRANGSPAFGQYKPDPENGGLSPWSVQVLELDGDRISGITFFLDTERLFPLFGLPVRFEA